MLEGAPNLRGVVRAYSAGPWTNPQTDYDAKVIGEADRAIALAPDNLDAYAAKNAYLYPDIGAAHPVQHSNTFHFYERGWSGLCVEPNPEFFALYRTYRPRDRAFNLGLSPESGTLRYHRFASHLINGFLGKSSLIVMLRAVKIPGLFRRRMLGRW
jgi:hypothetical protein